MRRASLSTSSRYSTGAIVLHWSIALALAFQLALGFAMPKGASGFAYYQFHKSVGIAILLLSLARLGWRLTHRPPPAAEQGWQGTLAGTVHVLLYVFMIGAPLTGWALVSTAEIRVPTILFGAIPWPHLPLPLAMGELFESAHETLAWIGLALVALHVAGALRHQLLLKDGLLGRMGPAGSALGAGLLALAVIGIYFGTGMTVASQVVANGGYPGAPPQRAPSAAPAGVAAAAPGEAVDDTAAELEPEATEAAEEQADAAAPTEWTVAPGGRLGFEARYDGQALRGTFPDWSARIALDPEKPETGSIAVTVRLAGATLGDATQDGMLHGAEGLGTGTATWRSTSIRRVGPGRYAAQGTLSLKGVSKSQPLTFRLTGDGTRRRAEGSATIDRSAFGISSGVPEGAADGTSVTVNFAFDATVATP
ncbi:cytochrome b/b6 domain-containing protein [Tsuneonella sp. HG222]